MGNTDDALKLYNTVLRIDPKFVPAIRVKAYLLSEIGKEEGVELYKDSLNLNPNDLQVLNNIGQQLTDPNECKVFILIDLYLKKSY
jgi:Tfp pilus assembly protein PilF